MMPQNGGTPRKAQKSDRLLASKSAVTVDEEYKMVRAACDIGNHACSELRASSMMNFRTSNHTAWCAPAGAARERLAEGATGVSFIDAYAHDCTAFTRDARWPPA